MTEDQLGAGTGLDAEVLGADGHAAVRADSDGSAHTPNERPPGAARDGTEDAPFLLLSQVPRLLGFHFEFPVDFVFVAMKPQVVDMGVGLIDVGDVFTGEVSGQALLPEEVTPFDFTFGLWGWSVTEADAVEVQSLAQLGEGLGLMGEKEAVEIDIDFQGQTIVDEGGGQEIEIGQEEFPFIDFGTGEEAAAIIEHVDHREQSGAVREPLVGRGIQLPEFTDPAALPTFDWSR